MTGVWRKPPVSGWISLTPARGPRSPLVGTEKAQAGFCSGPWVPELALLGWALGHTWQAPCVSGLRLAERHHRPHPHPSYTFLAQRPSPPSPAPWTTGFPVQARQRGQAEGVLEVPRDPRRQGTLFSHGRAWPGCPQGDRIQELSLPLTLHGVGGGLSIPCPRCVLLWLAVGNWPQEHSSSGSVSLPPLFYFP